MSLRPFDLSTTLRPTRALLHPLWIVSLGVLVLNDHVLKGASILPAELTGKLSDLAGLIVAPVLLAALLRVRSARGLALAHLAVGVVFSAIQLSAAAASGWSAAMAAVGFPWEITRDVTDLAALPALALSFWVLGAATARPADNSSRRTLELGAAGVGLVCCAATSPPPGEEFRPDLFTDVYVHNSSGDPVVVRVRMLSGEVDLDCDAVAEDPGRLITEPLFGESRALRLDPDQNFGLNGNWEWEQGWGDTGGGGGDLPERDCYAALLDVDGMPPAVAFWWDGDIPRHDVPALGYEEEPRGGIDMVFSGDPDRLGEWEELGDHNVLFLVAPAAPPVEGECAPQSDAGRLEWSAPSPDGTWELLGLTRGADGCFAFDLGTRDASDEISNTARWYLCAPMTELPLEPGRQLELTTLTGFSTDEAGVQVSTVDDSGGPTVEIYAYRGPVFASFRQLQVAAVPEFDCGYVVGERCGTVTRATRVSVGGGPYEIVELGVGEQRTLEGEGSGQMQVAIAHAEERAVLHPECAEGPDQTGLDLEVVALYTEPAG